MKKRSIGRRQPKLKLQQQCLFHMAPVIIFERHQVSQQSWNRSPPPSKEVKRHWSGHRPSTARSSAANKYSPRQCRWHILHPTPPYPWQRTQPTPGPPGRENVPRASGKKSIAIFRSARSRFLSRNAVSPTSTSTWWVPSLPPMVVITF
jgi:hypothetical protein